VDAGLATDTHHVSVRSAEAVVDSAVLLQVAGKKDLGPARLRDGCDVTEGSAGELCKKCLPVRCALCELGSLICCDEDKLERNVQNGGGAHILR